MRIGVLASVAHRTPPFRYGPWELVASTLAEGFVANTTGEVDEERPAPRNGHARTPSRPRGA